MESTGNDWSVKVWYRSGGFEQIKYIAREDAQAIAAEARDNDRVVQWEIHDPRGYLANEVLTTPVTSS